MHMNAVFIKVKEHLYRLNEASDVSILTLFMFLGDGLYPVSYIEFLNDREKNEFFGNVTGLQKQGEMITITLYDKVIPGALPFTTTVENLLKIIKEWDELRLSQVDTINLTIDHNVVTLVGT